MPNWIENHIKIKTPNPQEIIDEYFSKGVDEFFETIIPSPKIKTECPSKYIATIDPGIQLDDTRPWFNWYKWNVDNWGTKWGACHIEYEITKTGIEISFDTAWAPPLPIFEKLEKKYGKNISIRSYEEWGDICYKKLFNK